jgi:hypothetical protein
MFVRLLLLGLVLFTASALAGPLVAERSPLRPGLWWDPQHSGQGFDIHVAGEAVFVLWYTYRADGSPVWYTAHGTFDADDLLVAAWREHAWADGVSSDRVVGEARIRRQTAERVELAWNIHGRVGGYSLQPLPVAAVVPEVDHSGAWFEPERSGYGLTIAEQGDWLVLAYYFYDQNGAPTWLLGHNDGVGRDASMRRFDGPCPGCASRPVSASAQIASASLAFAGETSVEYSLVVGGGVGDSGIPDAFRRPAQALQMLSARASLRAADRQLAGYRDGEELAAALRALAVAGAPHLYPDSSIDFSPAPPTIAAISTTNLVESGVDEADRVKSDGRFVYTFAADEHARPLPALRIAEIVDGAPGLTLHAPVELTWPAGFRASQVGLYLHGDRMVALMSEQPWLSFGLTVSPPPPDVWSKGRFQLELFDRTDPAQPIAMWQAEIDGFLISSRRIGDQLYLVHRSAHLPDGLQRTGTDAATAHNLALLQGTAIEDLLPKIRIAGGEPQPLLDAPKVFLPPIGGRRPMPEFAVLTRINLLDPEDSESLAVIGGVESVYIAPEAVYIATTRYAPQVVSGGLRWPGFSATDIHRFELGGESLRLVGSGTVEGVVGRDPERAPFRFSERDGRLRLLTTGDFGDFGRNRLSVLEPSTLTPGLLKVLSQLPDAAQPAHIGKPDEELYGTRFVGDRLYVVTFQNIDPLYVIDLADPAAPRILGELELPGFSEYLHPLADGLLLGIGMDASPATGWGDGRFAWFQGLQIALFDVSDPSAPQLVDRQLLGERGSASAALADHHAFSALTLADGRLRFAIPARLHGKRFPAASGVGSSSLPWAESGLFAFDVVGSGASARLQTLEPLITRKPPQTGSPDDTRRNARSLLTANGVIYIEQGRFWTAPWTATGAPSGPQ